MMQRRSSFPSLGISLLGLVALLAIGVPAAGQQGAQQAGAPKAVVPQPLHDAQTVPKGQNVVHDFTIRNEGTAPLEITDVRPTCGCTVAEFDKVIAPGASGKVHAVLDTSTFDGPISKTVQVFTNDPTNPKINLAIKAKVEPYIFVQPGYARFIQPQLSDPGVVEEILWTSSFVGLEIVDVTSPFPYLTVESRRATEDELREEGVGPQYVLTLVFDYDRAPVGSIAEYVTVKTNHPQQSEVKIPVSGFVRPMVVVTPAEADFGPLKVDENGSTATMLLKHYGSQDLQVELASVDVPNVDVSVEPVEGKEGRQFRVRVKLEPEMAKGPFAGTIQLRTNHPKKPTLEIPLEGQIL